MDHFPRDYAAIEDSPAYREAQRIGASVAVCVGEKEYWDIFDPQESRLLGRAGPNNITFHIEKTGLDYELCVYLEGYVREPESYMRTMRRAVLTLLFRAEPPLPLKGTIARPDEKKLKLHLPDGRRDTIIQALSPESLTAAIQAAFAREYKAVTRACRRNAKSMEEMLNHLHEQYEKMMQRFAHRISREK